MRSDAVYDLHIIFHSHITHDAAVVDNLLVVASLLIGVAMVQAQNVNRLKDILRTMIQRGLVGFLNSNEALKLLKELPNQVTADQGVPALTSALMLKLKSSFEQYEVNPDAQQHLSRVKNTYKVLLASFWIISLAIPLILLLVFVVEIMAGPISAKVAFFASTLWWTSLVLIVFGWGASAAVALLSYRRDNP